MLTIFRNVREVSTPYFLTLSAIIERIKAGNSADLITKIRSLDSKKERGEIKAKLPSILFSGDFPNRKMGALPNTHSGLIVLDIDELGKYSMPEVGLIIKNDKYTHCSFISPSGRGYKVLFKIPSDTKRHVGYYLAIESHFIDKYDIKLDPSGKNIGRVCYESHDPEIYFNAESETFKTYIEPIKNTPKQSSFDAFKVTSEDKIIENVRVWWAKNYDFNSGRNVAIYHLASALNRFGVSKNSAYSFCSKYEDLSREKNPFTANEISRVVDNVYSQQLNKHGSETMEDTVKRSSVVDDILGAEPDAAVDILANIEGFEDFSPTELEEAAEEIQADAVVRKKKETRLFWFYDDGKLKIDIKDLVTFINDCGYYVYYPSKTPNSYMFIKITNNIIKLVDERDIKKTVLDFVEKKKQNVVYNLLSDRVKYWTRAFLNILPSLDPPVLRDSRIVSYIPTQSGVFKITKDNIIKIDYVDLTEGYVWESQITSKDFDYLGVDSAKNSDFAKFVIKVGGERIARLSTIIGYLLHNYNDPSNSKAVFLYDKNLSQLNGEPEGGSGKSLIIEGLKRIREVAAIPGDRVDFKRSFVFQELNESTQVAWVDELQKNADVTKFFSRITNGIPVEKKGKDPIYIESEVAPKFVFTTNFKPKGSSGSHVRRRIDFAVTDFFNSNNTPKQHYKKSFFTEWNKQEYDEFFSFYLECLRSYLKNGIIKKVDKDDIYLTILSECGIEVTKYWIDDGYLQAFKDKGVVRARSGYTAILDEHEIHQSELSIKKYLFYTRKIFKLHSIKFIEKGRRENLEFVIIK